MTDQTALGRLAIHFVETDLHDGCQGYGTPRLSETTALLKVYEMTCNKPGYWSECAEAAGDKAIPRLDNKTLFELAMRQHACSSSYVSAAFKKITDVNQLMQLLKKPNVQLGVTDAKRIIELINDAARIEEIAAGEEFVLEARMEAIDRLSNRQVLQRLTKHDSRTLRVFATARLEELARPAAR